MGGMGWVGGWWVSTKKGGKDMDKGELCVTAEAGEIRLHLNISSRWGGKKGGRYTRLGKEESPRGGKKGVSHDTIIVENC